MSKNFLADRMSVLEESTTLALNAKAKALAAGGRTIYNLTVGELACETPEYIQTFVAGKLNENKYTPPAGLPELREKIAGHCRQFYNLNWITSDNVIVTGSAKPALWAIFTALLDEDDEIIIPVPAWVSHIELVKIVGAKVITTKLDSNNDLDIADIRRKITDKTKSILLNSPHNPTGGIFSSDKLTQLAKLVNSKKIVIISDDIYSKLVYVNNFVPVPKHNFKYIVIIGGFSKSQAITGWRIGYLIAPVQIAKAVNTLLSHVTGNASLLGQYAGIIAMDHGDKQAGYRHLKSNRELVCRTLSEIENISFVKPAGAFYVFFDVSKMNKNSVEWCEQLLDKTGIALVPGEAFRAPGFARMSFVGNSTILETSLNLIAEFSINYGNA